MEDHRFAGSSRPTVGVELELQILDPGTLALEGAAGDVLAGVPAEFRRSIKPEYHDCCVEVATDVCRDVDEAGRDLRGKLAVAERAARGRGVLLGWGGSHPFSHWGESRVVPSPRYGELERRYRDTLRRQLTFGLHVHVGVADGDAAVRACWRIVEHLPALLALSADSPFWCGRCTGLHSNRVEVMDASPSSGPPPRLRSWDDYRRLAGRLTSTGLIGSAKELWWDARPSPENGTVEVRICDMPPDLDSALALTALIQCLVADLARADDGPGEDPDESVAAAARQNRWRAARYGMGAEFVDVRTGRREPAACAVLGLAGALQGVARELGCDRWLARAAAMTEGLNGAERQLAAFESCGDLAEVVRTRMVPGPPASHAAWTASPTAIVDASLMAGPTG